MSSFDAPTASNDDTRGDTIYGNSHNIYGQCHGSTIAPATHRVCYVHDYIHWMCKYSKSKGYFEIYSHPFGWKDCDHNNLQYIPSTIQTFCKEHPNKKVELKGGGHRDADILNVIDSSNKMKKLRDEFQYNNKKFVNCCVWLSAVLLMDKNNQQIASNMLQMMEMDLETFEWMFLTKIPNDYKGKNATRLVDMLQKKCFGYTLKKIPISKMGLSYLDYILDNETNGQFLCQLQSQGGSKLHVIGVDCNEKVILDCCEQYELKLTMNNLHHCCGRYLKGLKKIAYCVEMIKN